MSHKEGKLDRIYQKNFGRCCGCGKWLVREKHGAKGDPNEWQVDHDIPKSRGGSNHISNLWPMCADCNQEKADLTWHEFWTHKRLRVPKTMFGGRRR